MPNIIITNNCNLSCPYCFASSITSQQIQNIDINQFEDILQWCLNNNYNEAHIGLIGGEPTLHPQFKEILLKLQEYHNDPNLHLSSILFTNGLNLLPFLDYIPDNMSILINVNDLDSNNQNKLLKTLDTLYEKQWLQDQHIVKLFALQPKVVLGCNLYKDKTDYSFFWKIIDKYPEINKALRLSIVAPTTEYDKNHKEEYYSTMLPIFIKFIEESKKRYFKIFNDCNQIPICYLENNKELLNNLQECFINKPHICAPVIDINQDFQATSCFGISDFIDCNHFKNINELSEYFKYKCIAKKMLEKNDKCQNCEKFKFLKCQGGCFAFNE